MQVQFTAKRTQLPAFSAIQDCLAHADRASEACNDTSDRGNLHLPGRVANQEYAARSHAPLNGSPAVIHRYPRPLKRQRCEAALFHEAFKTTPRLLAVFADQPESRTVRRFRNQPVKVWRVIRNEPNTHGIR